MNNWFVTTNENQIWTKLIEMIFLCMNVSNVKIDFYTIEILNVIKYH